MCSGSSMSAIKASVNAPGNQQHHPSYDNAACAGSVISTACHPPSRFEESLTSTLPSMVGRDQEAAPKPDGRTQSNTTSILLASTPSMPPSWSMTDPSGRPLFADCQRSNPSMALKSSKSSHVLRNNVSQWHQCIYIYQTRHVLRNNAVGVYVAHQWHVLRST